MLLASFLLGCFGGTAGGKDTGAGEDLADGVVMDGGLFVLALTPDPDPPVTGQNTLHLRVSHGDDRTPVAGATLEIVPFMPEMGHGIQGEPDISELGDGAYDAEWSYPMSGKWEVAVTVSADDVGEDVYTTVFEVQ